MRLSLTQRQRRSLPDPSRSHRAPGLDVIPGEVVASCRPVPCHSAGDGLGSSSEVLRA